MSISTHLRSPESALSLTASPIVFAGLLCLTGLLLLGPRPSHAQALEDALLRAFEANAGDQFGYSVAIDGDRAIVGVPGEDISAGTENNSGAAYIFKRSGNSWQEVQTLRASNLKAANKFGTSVAIDGDRAIVGARPDSGKTKGAAYLFERSESNWEKVQTLRASDGSTEDAFGTSVTIDGDVAIVGANEKDIPNPDPDPFEPIIYFNAGAAYVFERTSSGWPKNEAEIISPPTRRDEPNFGASVEIDGDQAIIGAPSALRGQFNPVGRAFVFKRTDSVWTENQTLGASDPKFSAAFGTSVDIAGNRLIVGAPDYQDSSEAGNFDSGAAYVFERTDSGWPQNEDKILRASTQDEDDQLGESVAISEDYAIAGTPGEDGPSNNKTDAGAAYVFKRTAGGWPENENQILRASNADSNDVFGTSVAIDGNQTIVGAAKEDGPSNNKPNAGAAYTYNLPVASPPVAELEAATNITNSEATIKGLVTSDDNSTTAQVQYRSRDASTFQSTPVDQSPLTGTDQDPPGAGSPATDTSQGPPGAGSPAPDTEPDTVSARLSDLQAATTYKVRLVATNSAGADTSSLGTFTTPPNGPVATFNRTIRGTQGTGTDAGWRMLSVPAADVTRAQLEDDLNFDNFSPILYRWTGTEWISQDASSDRLPRGKGFLLYFFDDNSEPLSPSGIELDVKSGSENLLTDAEVDGLPKSEAFHLLGTPYESAFDLDSLAGGDLPGAGFQATVQVWNPKTQQYEQIVQGTPNNAVPAWQGFFAQRTILGAGDTSLTFAAGGKQPRVGALIGSESPPKAVVATQPSEKTTPNQAKVELQVSVASEDGDTTATDQATLWLSESAKSGYDAYEARDLSPPVGDRYVTATFPITRSDGSIEQRALASEPYPESGGEKRTVPLSVQGVGTGGTATLRWPDRLRDQVPAGWDVQLTDTKTGTTVNLKKQAYSFALPTGGKSGGPESARFTVALTPSPAVAELVSFGGTPTESGLKLEWTTPSAPSDIRFALQRRAAQGDWTTVGRTRGTDTETNYTLTDPDLPAGVDSLTYRLKQTGPEGTESVSDPITVARGDVESMALTGAYPNPASKQITVRYAVPSSATDARLALYDVMGRAVRRLAAEPGRTTRQVDVSGLASGTYVLRLRAEGTSKTKQVTIVR